jgi:diguanylate cyclase (GGDEF)-like protein
MASQDQKKQLLDELFEDFSYFDDLPCGVVIFALEKGRELVPIYRNTWYRRLFGYKSQKQAALKDNVFSKIYEPDRKNVIRCLMKSAEGISGEMTAHLCFDDRIMLQAHLRIWCVQRQYELPKVGMMITGSDNEEVVDPRTVTFNQNYRNIARYEATSSFDYDLEQDRFFYIHRDAEGKVDEHMVDHYLENLRNQKQVHISTIREYQKALISRENTEVDFLALTPDGEYEWRRATCTPATISVHGSVAPHMIGHIEPVESSPTAPRRPHMDQVTGLQDRPSTLMTINWILEARDESQRVFALVCLNGLNAVDRICGEDAGDRLLHRLGFVLSTSLVVQDVIGRYSGATFVIFIRHAKDGEQIQNIVENARAEILKEQEAIPNCPPIDLSFGRAVMPDEAKTLEEAEALANQRLDQKIAAWGEAHPAEEV